MKNLSITLNVVLIAAVAFLYYKVYTDGKTESPIIAGAGTSSNGIVFINSDSLLQDYNFFNSLKDQLETKQDSVDGLLKARASQLEKEVMNYQEQALGMSPDKRAMEEERLMGKQQQLLELKEVLLDELHNRESDMNDSIHANLARFLRAYNKDKNYLYILGYQRGSGILFANDSLDITSDVLIGLNAE